MNPPQEVMGVAVVRVLDMWYIDDVWGSRAYCKVETEDGHEVTMLRTPEEWKPVIIVTQAP